MSEWQPIETAPRDGTVVDLWVRSCFLDADGEKQVGTTMRVPDCIWFDNKWADEAGNPHPYLDGFSVEFTHWMPLPDPPLSVNDERLLRSIADADAGKFAERDI